MKFEELTAKDVMKSPVVTLDPDTPLEEAARTLNEYHISGALVSGADGRPSGVVSQFDIISFVAGLERPFDGAPGGFYRADVEEGEGWEEEWTEAEERPLRGATVEDVMARDVISVSPAAPLVEVARLLSERKIHRVFVIDGREPVGVISTMDLLAALAEAGPRRAVGNGVSHDRADSRTP